MDLGQPTEAIELFRPAGDALEQRVIPSGEPELGQIWRNATGHFEVVSVSISGSVGGLICGEVAAVSRAGFVWEGPTEEFLRSFEQLGDPS